MRLVEENARSALGLIIPMTQPLQECPLTERDGCPELHGNANQRMANPALVTNCLHFANASCLIEV